MNWVYVLAGLATLGILVYLLVALFHPEYFE
ncbi:MAG: potassium-transporting ATPase subunit F [Burkholderiales bacterium]